MIHFEYVRAFFESWGMYPSEEDTGDLNPEVIEQGINERCFDKLIDEAKRLHGDKFAEICSHLIDATDNAFYLSANTWDDLEDAWNEWLKRK